MFRYILLVSLALYSVQAEVLKFKITGKDLPKNDALTSIDPYVQVFSSTRAKKAETLLGQTTHKWDDRNPTFAKVFNFTYAPRSQQKLRFVLYDKSGFFSTPESDNYVGEGILLADEYKKKQMATVTLSDGSKGAGQLIIKKA